MKYYESMRLKSAFVFIASVAIGCGAVHLQPVVEGKIHVPTATKNNETSSVGQNLTDTRPGSKQTLSQIMKHEDDRMSGKVLWRNNKNHAAGSNCLCSFTQDKKRCAREKDDDTHCFLICCIAGKTSDCKCNWAIATQNACDASQNDGSECFASCCNDVARDLQTYGPLAYPGAELMYPPGVPVPQNPFLTPEQPAQPPGVQQLYPAAQPMANVSQGYYAAAPIPKHIPTPYTGAQSYPAASQSYPAGSQSYPAAYPGSSMGQGAGYGAYPGSSMGQGAGYGAYPGSNMSQGAGYGAYPAYPGALGLNGNATSNRTSNDTAGEGAANDNAGEGVANDNAGEDVANDNAGQDVAYDNAGEGAANDNASEGVANDNAGQGAANNTGLVLRKHKNGRHFSHKHKHHSGKHNGKQK